MNVLGSIDTPCGRLFLCVDGPAPVAVIKQSSNDEAIQARIARAEAKLTDDAFLSRAPSHVVMGVWQQLRADYARFL